MYYIYLSIYLSIFIYIYSSVGLSPRRRGRRLEPTSAAWPSQDIAMANIVWCMAYTRGAGGVSNIAQ